MSRSTLAQDVKFPPGRIVGGNLYKSSDKDADGKPRVIKTGQNAGQPMAVFFYAVAIPKTPGAVHWAHEPIWGSIIWNVGNGAFPKIAENPAFSWKITDGDSAVPNKKGTVPNTREGYPGHWVIAFNSMYAPKIVNADGSAYILEPNAVQPGDFVEVHATIDGNGSTQNPGVYINPNAVSFQGYSVLGRISTGIDPATAGFGQGPKPSGISATPIGGMTSAAPAVAARPAMPPGLPPALPGALPTVALPSAAPTGIVPSPGFLQPPPGIALPPPGAAAALPPPVIVPVRQMTPKAMGNTYEGLLAQGWTDALMVQHGMMVMG